MVGIGCASRAFFIRSRFRPGATDDEARKTTRRLSETAVAVIPQFFATAQLSMLADDGWRFSELGQFVERAITTANATRSVTQSIVRRLESLHSIEIELSAFLRLLGSRDAYRRIYQTRAEPPQVLEFLWQNAEMPRSVTYSLRRCAEILQASLPQRFFRCAKGPIVSRRIAQNDPEIGLVQFLYQ